MAPVRKLGKVTELRRLTLHGNPVSEDPNHRKFMLTAVPQVLRLDFVPISKMDRARARLWCDAKSGMYRRKARERTY